MTRPSGQHTRGKFRRPREQDLPQRHYEQPFSTYGVQLMLASIPEANVSKNVGSLPAHVSTACDCTNPCVHNIWRKNWDWLVREGNDLASRLPHPDNHRLHA